MATMPTTAPLSAFVPSGPVLVKPTCPTHGSMRGSLSPSSARWLPSMAAPRHDCSSHRGASAAATARRAAARSPSLCLEPELAPVRLRASTAADFSPPGMTPGTTPGTTVQVAIASPGRNCRKISAVNLIGAPIACVWGLLADYDHLADHIPNLVLSRRTPHPRRGGTRVEQCGAQSILGFEFRASLLMDMTEVSPTSPDSRAITFGLVSSPDFREFHGSWRLVAVDDNKTALYYSVTISPKGFVPVRALEWRIAEDVPQNMDAVRLECERRRRNAVAARNRRLEIDSSAPQPPQTQPQPPSQ